VKARYFKYVVSVAALARNEVKWSDSVRPNLIYAAHFEQKVLFWFIYFCASNPKMLSDWNRFANVHIQSTSIETLPVPLSKTSGYSPIRREKCFIPCASGQTNPFRIIIADTKRGRAE